MKKALGYILLVSGMLGIIFFLNYKGTAIPLKEAWFVLSIFVVIAGAYFFAKYKINSQRNQHERNNQNRLAEIERLRRTGEKVKVTLDNAEVKSRNYQQQIISDDLPSRVEMLDALYDDNRNYKSQEYIQTYIVHYGQYNGKTYKFISQSIKQDAESVRGYMSYRNDIYLYIDQDDPGVYYFDLPFL